MPRRNTIDTITLGIFSDENVSVICEDTMQTRKRLCGCFKWQ